MNSDLASIPSVCSEFDGVLTSLEDLLAAETEALTKLDSQALDELTTEKLTLHARLEGLGSKLPPGGGRSEPVAAHSLENTFESATPNSRA